MNSRTADDIVRACAAFIESDGGQSAEVIALAERLIAEFLGTFTLLPMLDAQRLALLRLRCGDPSLSQAIDPEVLPIARVAEEALTTAGFNADIKEIDPDGVTLVVSKPGMDKCFVVVVSSHPCFDPLV